jgi:UbiD family decarboxylase
MFRDLDAFIAALDKERELAHISEPVSAPMEDYYLGKASERVFLPLIRKTIPEIVDMHFPASGIFHKISSRSTSVIPVMPARS